MVLSVVGGDDLDRNVVVTEELKSAPDAGAIHDEGQALRPSRVLLIICLRRVGDESSREAADSLILILDGREQLVEALERLVLEIPEDHVDAERVARLALANLPGSDYALVDLEDPGEVGSAHTEGFASAA
jgi:hypothetical protein